MENKLERKKNTANLSICFLTPSHFEYLFAYVYFVYTNYIKYKNNFVRQSEQRENRK